MRLALAAFSALCLTCIANSVTAQAAPDGSALLEQSGRFAQSIRTVYGDMLSTVTGGNEPGTFRAQVWADLPDKSLTRHDTPGGGGISIYLDGTKQTSYFPKKNQYNVMQLSAPRTAENVQDVMAGPMSKYGPLKPDAAGRQVQFIGKESLGGAAVNHVRITVPGIGSGDVWIADGAQPLPIYATMQTTQPPLTEQTHYRWIVNQPIQPAVFQFTPPPGATDMTRNVGGRK